MRVFATRWKHDGQTPEQRPDDRLRRFAQFCDLFRDKGPQLLDATEISVADLEFRPENESGNGSM